MFGEVLLLERLVGGLICLWYCEYVLGGDEVLLKLWGFFIVAGDGGEGLEASYNIAICKFRGEVFRVKMIRQIVLMELKRAYTNRDGRLVFEEHDRAEDITKELPSTEAEWLGFF